VYNHGFIVKTPSKVFAFDLIPFNVSPSVIPNEVLDQIDVLFVSHTHGDHSNPPLQSALRKLGGEVVTTANFALDATETIAGLEVTANYGQHSVLNYIFTITTPEGLRVMHTGDTQHSRWLPTDQNVDVMLVNAWMNESGSRSATEGVRNAVNRVAPKLTLTGHEHEMQHLYEPWNSASRVPYEWPLAVDDEPIPGDYSVMMWGERYDYEVEPLVYHPPAELPLVINALYSDSDNDVDSVFDGQGDRIRDQTRRSLASVGEVDGGTHEISRVVAKFALPDLAAGTSADLLERATLRFYLDDIDGTPAGPVSVLHSVSDNTPIPSGAGSEGRFEDPTFVDTLMDLVDVGDEVGRYFELDVTEQVLADFAADGLGAIAAFRLQVDGASFLDDGQGNSYQFAMLGDDANPPQLVLTFVPEPATSECALSALVTMCFARWPRQRRVW